MHELKGRDLLSIADLTPDELMLVIDRAQEQKAALAAPHEAPVQKGKAIALIFMKPSLRTRVSFEKACVDLGYHPIVLGPGDAFSREETVHDTVKVLERFVDAIVLRTFAHAHVEEVAKHASIPVVNALTDDHHPCQMLADLLTIREHKGGLQGLKIAYIGDGNNMANTYMLGGALAGIDISIASPVGYQPSAAVVEQARGLAARYATRATIEVLTDPVRAVAGADIVMTDTWASMGQEAEHARRVRDFAGYTVDAALMTGAARDALFMHCLPAHRGEEVSAEVIDAPYSVIFDEAENRLHAQRAWLSLVL